MYDVLVTVWFRIPVVSCSAICLSTSAAWQHICISNLPLLSSEWLSFKSSTVRLIFFFPQGQGSNSGIYICQSGNSTMNLNSPIPWVFSSGLSKVDVQDGCPLGWSGKCWNFWLHSSLLFCTSQCIYFLILWTSMLFGEVLYRLKNTQDFFFLICYTKKFGMIHLISSPGKSY